MENFLNAIRRTATVWKKDRLPCDTEGAFVRLANSLAAPGRTGQYLVARGAVLYIEEVPVMYFTLFFQ
jgi:hypothetical protein